MQRHNNNSGFTLIELLVVIAIIAILAAILFPVFAQARVKARQAVSISNFNQIDLAMMMYRQDYDEVNVPGWMIGPENDKFGQVLGEASWQWFLQPYMKSLQALEDPSAINVQWYGLTEPGPLYCCGDYWRIYQFWNTGISLNIYMHPGVTGLLDAGYWGGTFPGLGPGAGYNLPDAEVAVPTNRIVLLNTNGQSGYPWGGPLPQFGIPFNAWEGSPPDSADPNAYPAGGFFGYPPYNQMMTLAFYDGHTKAMRPSSTQQASDASSPLPCCAMWDLIRP